MFGKLNLKFSFPVVLVISATFLISACTKKSFHDEERDKMVSIHKVVKKVLKDELQVDEDRLSISQNLGLLGISEDNKLQIQDELEKELGIKIPYSTLNAKGTIGTIVRYAAKHQGDVKQTTGDSAKESSDSKIDEKKKPLKLFTKDSGKADKAEKTEKAE